MSLQGSRTFCHCERKRNNLVFENVRDKLRLRQSHEIASATKLPCNDSKKVLIVDDYEDILEFIAKALKKFYKDIKTETATEGFIAGKRIAEFKPDLLILDIRLPGMDGFEVLRYLKKENMKVLAITAYPSKEIKEKILKSLADDFLVKPFTVEQLKEKIQNLLKI